MIRVIELPDKCDSEAAIRRAAQALDQSLIESGFVYLANHGVDRSCIDAAFSASRQFHAQCPADKEKVSINRFHRGYMKMASSVIVTSSVEPATKPNISESFLIMQEQIADSADAISTSPIDGPNQWPDNIPGFREHISGYNEQLEALCYRILTIIEMALQIAPGSLARFFGVPTTFLRLLHYPPSTPTDDVKSYGSAPHTDYGFITVLAQDQHGGLEVQNKSNQWIAATPIEGTMVMNIGDMTEIWSNGRWRSTRHRVVSPKKHDRYSIPFFFDPEFKTIVEPILKSEKTSSNIYVPTHYGDYLMHRLDRNYAYRGKQT